MRPATSSRGSQAVADAGGSLWWPRRASHDWGELRPELLPWDDSAIARASRSADADDPIGEAPPRFFEEVYGLIVEADRYRVACPAI